MVLGVVSDDSKADAESFVIQMGLTFPVLFDDGGAVHALYQMESGGTASVYPQDWVVGAAGEVVYHNNHYEPDEMIAVIEAELDGIE